MKISIKKLSKAVGAWYTRLYENVNDTPEATGLSFRWNYHDLVAAGDQLLATQRELIAAAVREREDYFTSDRELAALACAVREVAAHDDDDAFAAIVEGETEVAA